MKENVIDKNFYALDTFDGFVADQVEYEVEHRGKDKSIRSWFSHNRKSWYDATIKANKADPVISIQADAANFDYGTIGPLSFSLVDVDLYQPISRLLPAVWDNTSPGGIIVVDDCAENTMWDGARQAFIEFVTHYNLEYRIVHEKLGVVVKP